MRPSLGLASTVVIVALASPACGSSPPSGTAYLVKDINVGRESSWPGSFTNVRRDVLFRASGGAGRRSLWKTDGTPEGTVFVKEVTEAGPMTTVGGSVFFSATDPEHGHELWKSDGSFRGTELVKEIYPGSGVRRPGLSVCSDTDVLRPSDLTPLNGVLYFFAEAPESGRELWRSDGTAAGTFLVKETQPGPDRPLPPTIGAPSPGPAVDELTIANGALFFRTRAALWRSDGSAGGTVPIANVAGRFLTPSSRWLYFFVEGAGLWTSDGTTSGTAAVRRDLAVAARDRGPRASPRSDRCCTSRRMTA